QDETDSSEIYLYHLDELLLSHHASRFGTFFIVTHRGCAMNCLYCGGCSRAQQKTFNRKSVFRRGVEEVRKDIIEAKEFTSTFQFDFDLPHKNLLEYCRNIWEGIGLSDHFCIFATLTPPSKELVTFVSQTFKYVYWDFDICTPSERHRDQLVSLGLVKPQPSDNQILDFMAKCEKHSNIEVRLNLITGLPYFTSEDIGPGKKLLHKIMNTYSCFGEMHWARLHAQPGAPIVQDAAKYDMHSYASTFENFLTHSKENFDQTSGYLSVEDFNYPYIYFNDEQLNSSVTNFYLEINKKTAQHTRDKRRGLNVSNTLTYRQLNENAEQLTGALIAKGVRSGGIVGLMLERSIEIPVGILGIIKAGCAYIPIDPEFPSARIKYMLSDCKARVLVTSPKLRVKVQAEEGFIDTMDISSLSSFPTLTPTDRIGFATPAYVIYTSGTTGKPKGTLLTHENLVNYVHWFSTTGNLTANDKTVLTSSFAFDLGYTSLYTALLNGGELHILPRDIYLLAERFLDYIKQQRITYIKVTPSLFSVLVNASNFSKETCRSLRLAAIGGEAIKVEDIEKAHSICSHLQIMNHYGPTEATIGCVAIFVDFDEFEEYRKHPAIGKPIHNTNVYILSRDLNLLPAGVPGELCISGAGLALGYLNRPELTAEKFPPVERSSTSTPLPLHPSNPLYRTGDLACWLPDGTIEFLGRIDKQVKIRGYRIELAEIEDRLLSHEQVKEALVTVREAPGGDTGKGTDNKYLCAYFVSEGGKEKNDKNPTIDKSIISLKEIAGRENFENEDTHPSVVNLFRDQAQKNRDKIAVQSNDRSLTYQAVDKYAGRVARKILEEYEDRDKLSKSERTRYKRQMLLYGWGQESQEKLKGAVVFVAGAGGGASPTIVQLALAGVGTIKVCDFDSVELSNLNRQFLHDDERLGMNKALSAQVAVGKINPHVKVIPYTQKLTGENVSEMVGDADIIFDMFDGLADKFVLSEYAVEKGIPHIIISMTDINAYSTVCHTPATPCLHCLFDKRKLETIVSGMQHYDENYNKNPLPVVATSLFISTGVAVNEALKILLGFRHPAYNKFFYFNQRGEEENLVITPGYKAMTYLFSDHFLEICREQGFDWETSGRGNFLEELTIIPNPDCPLCGAKRKQKLDTEFGKSLTGTIPPGVTDENKDAPQTVALLLDRDVDMAAALIGALKSRKTYVPFDPVSSPEKLSEMLEDSEARVIITDNKYLKPAEKLKDKVNRNVKIVNISGLEQENGDQIDENFAVEISAGQTPHKFYPSETAGRQDFNESIMGLYRTLLSGSGPYFFAFDDHKPEPGTDSLPGEMRAHLLNDLPDYMVPSYFVSLDKMPLTPNGKVDRKALPDPEISAEQGHKGPRNDVEEKLLDIWSALLEKEKDTIGIDSNFFQLGGHSLNVTIMAARVNKELNVKLPVGEVFKIPTIRELSRYLMGAEKVTHSSIQPVEKKEYYPLSSAQMRMFLLSQLKTTTSDNTPGVYQVEGSLDRQRLEDTINRIIERHELLRTSFEMVDHQPVQRVHDRAIFKITHIEAISGTRPISGREIKDIIDGFVRPFKLSEAPLLRVGLLKLMEEKHLLIYDMHHIISDATSFQIFIGEFMSLFAGMELPTVMRIQYKDFTVWQNSLKESGVLKKQEEYWLNVFSGDIPTLNLSTDFPRQTVRSFEGDTVMFILDNNLAEGIYESASQVGATIYMALLAIYNILLYKLTGQEDIVVGSSSAGRPHTDLEHVIGFFVNTLAMRNYPRGEITYLDFLKSVKANALKAYENQDYQFDELVNRLGIQRDAGRQVLFDTHFTLQNRYLDDSAVPTAGPRLGNLRFSNYPMDVKTTQFDIIIHAYEVAGGFRFILNYCSKLFKRETIERFTKHYEDIARIVAENKNIELKNIKISHRLETAQTDMPEVNFNF
ncbi:MAG: amino acid adenylation domain-containing protein, partial [bacterium]|nr:amino acid adenylation domain-containing protein [bacterium]